MTVEGVRNRLPFVWTQGHIALRFNRCVQFTWKNLFVLHSFSNFPSLLSMRTRCQSKSVSRWVLSTHVHLCPLGVNLKTDQIRRNQDFFEKFFDSKGLGKTCTSNKRIFLRICWFWDPQFFADARVSAAEWTWQDQDDVCRQGLQAGICQGREVQRLRVLLRERIFGEFCKFAWVFLSKHPVRLPLKKGSTQWKVESFPLPHICIWILLEFFLQCSVNGVVWITYPNQSKFHMEDIQWIRIRNSGSTGDAKLTSIQWG